MKKIIFKIFTPVFIELLPINKKNFPFYEGSSCNSGFEIYLKPDV
jgi:hypothetical protein